jgi:peptidyl-prolyl cis-trans isomerase A (cyclophilin A)
MWRTVLFSLTFSLMLLLLTGCSTERPAEERAEAPPPVAEEPEVAPVPAKYRASFKTTQGDFVLEVISAQAPIAAERFFRLMQENYYDGCPLYRVRPGFVVQWGISNSPRKTAKWNQEYLPDEPRSASNVRGAVSFASQGPDSRTMQVFVNLGNNSPLDAQGFVPFGRVISGMGVFEKFQSYGEDVNQSQLTREGGSYIEMYFPKMDRITETELVEVP